MGKVEQYSYSIINKDVSEGIKLPSHAKLRKRIIERKIRTEPNISYSQFEKLRKTINRDEGMVFIYQQNA